MEAMHKLRLAIQAVEQAQTNQELFRQGEMGPDLPLQRLPSSTVMCRMQTTFSLNDAWLCTREVMESIMAHV